LKIDKRGKNPNSLKNLEKRKPFTKKDPRINPGGRVKSFEQLRELFQQIANEPAEEEKNKTRIQKIGEILSKDKKHMKDFIEFGYGKVPQPQIITGNINISWKDFVNNDSDTDNSNAKDDSE